LIRAIVSDLGKVLLGFDTEPGWGKVAATCSPRGDLRAHFARVVEGSGFQTGAITPDQFYELLCRECGLAMPFEEFKVAWSDQFWEDAETIELICGAPVEKRYMLSNTNEIHWDWIRARHPEMLSRFDRLIVSHEVGLQKPDPAIFRLVVEETGFRPEEHLFIDDIEANHAGAREIGMDTIVHTDAASLRRDFQRRGLA
jgi:putative hydrolase of the HAD superfamily